MCSNEIDSTDGLVYIVTVLILSPSNLEQTRKRDAIAPMWQPEHTTSTWCHLSPISHSVRHKFMKLQYRLVQAWSERVLGKRRCFCKSTLIMTLWCQLPWPIFNPKNNIDFTFLTVLVFVGGSLQSTICNFNFYNMEYRLTSSKAKNEIKALFRVQT